MIRRMMRFVVAAAVLAGVAALSDPALAQNYPTKSISMIVPFGAGGGTDITARTVSEELSKALGRSIIVETRPGGAGGIGCAVVAKAAPDGYTLLFTASSTYSLNPNLLKELPYDQLNDFVPVATISRSPWLLVVPAKSEFTSVADVVKAAKASPGKLTLAYHVSSTLVTGDAFQRAADIQLRRVPYKGSVEATTDLLAARVNLLFMDTSGSRPHVEAGTMRILATTTAKRTRLFPGTPTMTELGLPVVTDSVLMVFAPIKTPKPILERLNREISKIVMTSKNVGDKLNAMGMEPVEMNLIEADVFVRSEISRWAEMIKKAGLEKQ